MLGFPHFRSGHSGNLCNCNMNFITTCSVMFLSCPSEACMLEVQSVCALFPPVNMLFFQYLLMSVSFCFHCEVTCTSLGREGVMKWVHNQRALPKALDFLPTLP